MVSEKNIHPIKGMSRRIETETGQCCFALSCAESLTDCPACIAEHLPTAAAGWIFIDDLKSFFFFLFFLFFFFSGGLTESCSTQLCNALSMASQGRQARDIWSLRAEGGSQYPGRMIPSSQLQAVMLGICTGVTETRRAREEAGRGVGSGRAGGGPWAKVPTRLRVSLYLQLVVPASAFASHWVFLTRASLHFSTTPW